MSASGIWRSRKADYSAAEKLAELDRAMLDAQLSAHGDTFRAIAKQYNGNGKPYGRQAMLTRLTVIEGAIIYYKKKYRRQVADGSVEQGVAATRLDIVRSIARDLRAQLTRGTI